MLNEFLTHINENFEFKSTDKILLAVSGGKDSVAMFDLFLKANFLNFGVAHCNFQLRGDDANEDEVFVKNLCEKHKITFHSIRFETKKYAQENNLSTQLAARELRYEWFNKIREEYHYNFISTAHHFNDVIETILLNLTKGTGIAGLHGIPKMNGFIIRPLLFLTREKIDNYIDKNKLFWREDSSNLSNDYQRNLLRNEVIPLLKKINPNLEKTFQRNVERFVEVEKIVRKEIKKLSPKISNNKTIILEILTIKSCESANYILEEFLKQYNFNTFQAKNIYDSLDKKAGKIFYSSTHILTKDRENLIIEPLEIEQNLEPIKITLADFEHGVLQLNFANQSLEFSTNNSLKIDENSLKIDFEKIVFPLTIRAWQQGDFFIPSGMKGRKKISDFLIDKKISLHKKKHIYLLISDEKVVCILNYRVDERFKTSATTHQFLYIK